MRQTKLVPGEIIGKGLSSGVRYLARVNLGGSQAARMAAYANWDQMLNQGGVGDVLILPDRKTIIVAGGTWSAAVTGAKSLMKLDLETGAILLAATAPSGSIGHAALSPDNQYVVVVSNAAPYIQIYDVATLTLQSATPDVSPGGTVDNVAFIGSTRIAVSGPGAAGPEGNGRLLIYSWPGLTRQAGPLAGAMPAVGYSWSQIAATPDAAKLVMSCSTSISGNPGGFLVYDTTTWSQLVTTAIMANANYQTTNELKISPNGKYAITRSTLVSAGNMLICADISTNPPTKVPLNLPLSPANTYTKFVWLDAEHVLVYIVIAAVSTAPPVGAYNVGWVIHVPSGTTVETRADDGLQAFSTQFAFTPGMVYRKLSGTVKDGAGNPLARTVVALDKETLAEIGRATSSAVDGSFVMSVFSSLPAIVLSLGAGAEVTKLFDSVVPVATSKWPNILVPNRRFVLHLSGNVTDATGNTSPVANNMTYATAQFGQGGKFTRDKTKYVNIPPSSSHNISGSTPFCISHWFSLDVAPDGTPMALMGKAAALDQGFYTCVQAGSTGGTTSIGFMTSASGTSGSITVLGANVPALVLGRQYHMAVTNDGTTQRLFLDGQMVASRATTSIHTSSAPLQIGRINVTDYEYPFSGTIDEVMLVIGEPVWTSDFVVPSEQFPA